MKSMILAAVVALSGSFAVAADHTSALDLRTQADLYKNVGPHRVCVEGTRQAFSEVDQYDREITTVRTCKNGRYFAKTKTVGRPCKEGAVATWSVSNSVNDNQRSATFICTGGKYVQAN